MMHSYSTSRSRVAIYGALAVPAVVVAWAIGAALSQVDWPQWLVSAPSLTATYGVLYAVFDRYLWRSPFAQRVGLVDVVDLSGVYEGQLTSTFRDEDGNQVSRDIRIQISQTWTRISVTMHVVGGSSSSTSDSANASIQRSGDGMRLAYMYQNRVNPGIADADMGDHTGAAELTVTNEGRLTGRYFNSRPRAGTIEARRISTPSVTAGVGGP